MKYVIFLLTLSLFVFTNCSNDKADQKIDKSSINSETTVKKNHQGLDISKINVCELIPAELLADKIGGKVLKPAHSSSYGTTKGCEYEIDPQGPDNYEYCAIWLYPTDLYEDSKSELETAKNLGQEATAEQLTDYGDESYVIHNKSEDQSIIHVLLKDKIYIEVKAEKFDDAKKITELVLTKIK